MFETSSGMNDLNIRTNESPKWDRTRYQEDGKIVMIYSDVEKCQTEGFD